MIEVNLVSVCVFLIAVHCTVKSAVKSGMRAYEEAKQKEQLTLEEA